MATHPTLDPHFDLPTAGPSCGNRLDLPRKQRVHDWRDAGRDVRYQIDDGSFALCDVRICIECGRDGQRKV